MVVFCVKCGVSLPNADVLIKNGQEKPSPYYRCPVCRNMTGETDITQTASDLSARDGDVVIRDGKVFRQA
ncbi:MAG: hypothetical protein KAS70_00525 [Planctomycetes bacterium]|nr:hypothetical protein [Planctomycetota bacterium]